MLNRKIIFNNTFFIEIPTESKVEGNLNSLIV